VALVEHFRLAKGEKSITVPKVAQMTAWSLTDGVDLGATEDIGMTTVSLTTAEVGLKVILTDKLVRQENQDVFRIVGRQMGDAMARKKDRDIIALFSALNGGTTLGAAASVLTLTLLSGCIAWAKNAKCPQPIVVVHHPYAIFDIMASAALTPVASTGSAIPHGFSEDLLKDFFKFTINGVTVFEDGNIDADASSDGIGAIFSKAAMCTIDSQELRTERERDASLRATEVVLTADYGCFELDDSYGAAMTYDVAAPGTT
jgi:hypothetical protein